MRAVPTRRLAPGHYHRDTPARRDNCNHQGRLAEICENCGEYYLSKDISGEVLPRAESAVQSGAEVKIIRFAA